MFPGQPFEVRRHKFLPPGIHLFLGHAIQVGTAELVTARVFAAVTLLAAMAIALFAAVAAVERWIVPWSGREES